MSIPQSITDLEARRPSDSIMKQRFYQKALQLEPKTHFSCVEIEGLLRIFDKLVEKYQSPMNKIVFKDVLFNFFGLTNDLMLERVFRTMTNGKSFMTHDDWIAGMDIYLRGSAAELAEFAFTVYDYQKRDFLSKEDIQMYLEDVIIARMPDEDVDECQTDMLDMVFVMFDQDKDGYISRKDFLKSVQIEPLLLQVLGECIPPLNTALTLDSLIKCGNERDYPF
ncbi:unnamed protein product [Dicrocoelium dendriticum]|nr:unnamed protein product [Dicrocoelium dendriticum]